MWRVIGISPEKGLDREQERIISFLENKEVDIFHIRKPHLDINMTRIYLESFPKEIRFKLTIHYHSSLALELGLGGVHYNLHNPYIKPLEQGLRKTYSCHNLTELIETKERFDYVFLSPIYNSISKHGYESKFNLENLKNSGLIDEKVIALGGIKKEKFEELKSIGFGGVALLGSLWNRDRK